MFLFFVVSRLVLYSFDIKMLLIQHMTPILKMYFVWSCLVSGYFGYVQSAIANTVFPALVEGPVACITILL